MASISSIRMAILAAVAMSFVSRGVIAQQISQWVSKVRNFSTETGPGSWSANQIIGPPNIYPSYGDIAGGWEHTQQASHSEFIEFEINATVIVNSVETFENWKGGYIVGIYSLNTSGQWDPLYTGAPTLVGVSRIFAPTLQVRNYPTNVLRLNLDCSLATSAYCELDAVRINGTLATAVDGAWSAWLAWGACTVTCGGGVQTRTRTCTNPAPSGGGLNCPGISSQQQSCKNNSCGAAIFDMPYPPGQSSRLMNSTLEITTDGGSIACATMCLLKTGCVSFNFAASLLANNCELNGLTHLDFQVTLSSAVPEWHYYYGK